MICPHCGKEFKDGHKFCTNCGMAATQQLQQILPVTPAPAPVQAPAENKTSDLAQSILNAVPSSPASQYLYDEKNKGKKKKEKKVKAEKTPKAPKAAGEKKPKGKIFKKVIAITLVISILGAGGYFGWKYIPGLFASKDEAMGELIVVLDDADKVVEDFDNQMDAYSESDDSLGALMDLSHLADNTSQDLDKLRQKAEKIQGLDQKTKDAVSAYFDMTINAYSSFKDVSSFYSYYVALMTNFIYKYPSFSNYSDISAFFTDYEDWYNSTQNAVDTIQNIPSSVQMQWDNFKEAFGLSANIYQKLAYAVAYNDFLSYYSANNLISRFELQISNTSDMIISDFQGECDFLDSQIAKAKEISKELHEYKDLSKNDKESYSFKYTSEKDMILDYDVVSDIYPSLYNTYDAFAIVKTGCLYGKKTIVIEAEIPGFTQKFKQTFDLDPSYKAIYIKPAVLTGDIDLSIKKDAQMNISVYEKDGKTLIESQSFPIEIKGKNDFVWIDDEFGLVTRDNILCYLNPNSANIEVLKRNAITELSTITGGMMDSIVGYQKNYYNDKYIGTYLQAAGIMRALYDMGIRYETDGYTLDQSAHQYIKLPDEVIDTKAGLCIETSLVVASALQSAGFHCFIVMPTGHAQVAVELWENTGEYFLIETTCLTADMNNNDIIIDAANAYLQGNGLPRNYPIRYLSQEEWNKYIQENNCYIIDCNDAKTLGMTPFSN